MTISPGCVGVRASWGVRLVAPEQRYRVVEVLGADACVAALIIGVNWPTLFHCVSWGVSCALLERHRKVKRTMPTSE
ncbi:hypothetical protein PUN28_013723 [Cardiocondyla obscurior]|uniref:Uncharacterized protein n=1 Tax=Cardiocondyla obscurior TaxID=286306 RepID=A0AAW2F5Y1_9HYME